MILLQVATLVWVTHPYHGQCDATDAKCANYDNLIRATRKLSRFANLDRALCGSCRIFELDRAHKLTPRFLWTRRRRRLPQFSRPMARFRPTDQLRYQFGCPDARDVLRKSDRSARIRVLRCHYGSISSALARARPAPI